MVVRPQHLLVQEMLLQKLGSEVLRWRLTIRTAFGRKVHEIPIGPHRIHVISLQLGPPKMEDIAIVPPEHIQDGPLHVVVFTLAFVIALISGAKA